VYVLFSTFSKSLCIILYLQESMYYSLPVFSSPKYLPPTPSRSVEAATISSSQANENEGNWPGGPLRTARFTGSPIPVAAVIAS
jgi:hypothetical protein